MCGHTKSGIAGKKWFMQPSLTAQAGRVTGPPVTFSNTMYQHIRTLAELSMQMETAAILILRKVLNPDIPAHQVSLMPLCIEREDSVTSLFGVRLSVEF